MERSIKAVRRVLLITSLAAIGLTLAASAVGGREGDSSTAPPPTILWGRVLDVEPNQGRLVLGHEDGTTTDLVASPRLLRLIRVGETVQAVVDGAVVRFVEPVGAPLVNRAASTAPRVP
jgi:hypothetical protein